MYNLSEIPFRLLWYKNGEPNNRVEKNPTSIWAAVHNIRKNNPLLWLSICEKFFGFIDTYELKESDIMSLISDTNVCTNLDSPVTIWIDPDGEFSIKLYESKT